MSSTEYYLLILGMGAVTYIPRWLPLFFLSRRQLPHWFVDWLDLIPAAVLSALLLPALVVKGEPKVFDLLSPELIAALPTLAFALATRSLGATVVVGMGSYWLIGKVI
jgi:branched-subunit amino acid transport protein